MKIGKIYRQIVKNYFSLNRKYNTENCKEFLQENNDFETIEAKFELKDYTAAAINALRQSLAKYDILLPDDFDKIVLLSENPEKDSAEIINQIEDANIGRFDQVLLAAKVSQSVHEVWRKKHRYRAMIEEKLMLMPFELIGVDKAAIFFGVIKPILRLLSLRVDNTQMTLAYEALKKEYIDKNGQPYLSKNDM